MKLRMTRNYGMKTDMTWLFKAGEEVEVSQELAERLLMLHRAVPVVEKPVVKRQTRTRKAPETR